MNSNRSHPQCHKRRAQLKRQETAHTEGNIFALGDGMRYGGETIVGEGYVNPVEILVKVFLPSKLLVLLKFTVPK